MRNLVLGGLLAVTSATAVAYVLVNPAPKPCSACVEPAPPAEVVAPSTCEEVSPTCSKCKSGVVDVVDLTTAYPVGPTGTGVSFDEPPLAKPRSPQLIATRFESTLAEEAPMPREAAELAPAPRPAK